MTDELPPAMFLTNGSGEGYVGTVLARGPWDDNAAHGGPVAALIGREVERHDPDPGLITVRYTIELLRPVTLSYLRLEATTLRPGKRVRLIGVHVYDEAGTEVARTTALRVAPTPPDAPLSRHAGPPPFALPEESAPAPSLMPDRVGVTAGVELRSAAGSAVESGPATYWFRMHVPLVDDEPISPLSRAMVAADFGNGIASVTSISTHVFINPDLTVHLHRLPEGDWVANDAVTWLEPGGTARADAVLYDRNGAFGRATQSLYIAAR